MNLPALPVVATPSTPPGLAPKNTDEPGAAGFAQCLEQAREGESGTPDDAATEAPVDDTAVDTPPRLHGRGPADRARQDPARIRIAALVAGKGSEKATPADEHAAEPVKAGRDPADIATLLPGWTCSLPLPTPTPLDAGLVPTTDTSVIEGDAAVPTRLGMARPALASSDDATQRSDARDSNSKTAALALPLPAQDAAVMREAFTAIDAAPPRARQAEPNLVVGLPAAAGPALPSAVARSDAVATAHVAEHVDSPAFAPTLATQLRWLAQERVQQAQITLNPAGMGPLAVQIVIDGANARVDFSADNAATRLAIEASLPVLAAALDEGGLKLSGGGVHDGAAQRHPAWSSPAQVQHASTRDARSDDRGFATAPRAAAARGLVDLVA